MPAEVRRYVGHYTKGDPLEVWDESPDDYEPIDGVNVDVTETPRPTSRAFGEFTRGSHHLPTRLEKVAEEVSWAARSGPVYIIRPAKRER